VRFVRENLQLGTRAASDEELTVSDQVVVSPSIEFMDIFRLLINPVQRL
jgi:hypothetical protein